MSYHGDISPSTIIYLPFTTVDSGRAPIVLTGSPAVSVYKDDGAGESTAGVTLSASFDSRVGLNLVKIDTSADGSFYAAGHDFSVVITTGTVDSISAVGYVIGSFSIEHRSVGSGTAPTAATVATAVWDQLLSAITTSSSIGKLLKDDIDTTVSSRLASASITLSTGAVTVGTNNDKTGYALSSGGVQAIWDALTSALTTSGSIGKLFTDNIAIVTARIGAFTGSGFNTILGFLKAVMAKTATTPSDVGGTFDAATDSLEAIVDVGVTSTAPTAADVADAVWDEVRAGHTTSGTFGQGAASVQGNITGSVASLTTNNDKTGYALSAAGVDAIWDEALSGHATSGTSGKALDDAAAAGTPPTAAAIADQVWDEVRSGHTTSGTFGQGAASVQGNITGSVASLTTNNDKTGYSLSATGLDATLPSGAVVSDAGNTTLTFKTNRTETATDYWKDAFVVLTSGVMAGQVHRVIAYNGTTKFVTVSTGFTAAPAAAVTFLLVIR